MEDYRIILDLLQTEFQYDFRKGPRQISAGTVFTVFICILASNYRKYRKFCTGRNLTRTFPKIEPKFVVQKVYIDSLEQIELCITWENSNYSAVEVLESWEWIELKRIERFITWEIRTIYLAVENLEGW